MTKEEQAHYCAEHETMYSPDVQQISKNDLFNIYKERFLAGYEAAQSGQDEMMIAFAKWHAVQSSLEIKQSDKELLDLFKKNKEA